MGRLNRPLNPDAIEAADDELYSRHANDPRPNALYDADGNRTPLDPDDPAQAGLREEWTDLYRESNNEPEQPTQPGDRPVGSPVESCPLQHWIQIQLIKLPDLEARKKWWPKDDGGPYPYEPFHAEITDGPKDGALNGTGIVRYDCIPAGTCSIQFKSFFEKIDPELDKGSGDGSEAPVMKCPTRVTYKEYGDQEYGWDDKTSRGPWKSVEKGESDKARAHFELDGGSPNIAKFESSKPDKVTVSPEQAAAEKEILTFTGVSNGDSVIKATCDGGNLGKMRVQTYTRKTKTVAVRLVHETHYSSTDVSDEAVKRFLKKVYNQAVFEWKWTRLPPMTLPFDLNGDGMIDVDSWMSDEMKVIRDECKDDSFDHNLFLVDNPSDGSLGFMAFNQRYGYVHAGSCEFPESTVAHELGHGGWGLEHRNEDKVNVMSQVDGLSAWRLRKEQWDDINP